MLRVEDEELLVDIGEDADAALPDDEDEKELSLAGAVIEDFWKMAKPVSGSWLLAADLIGTCRAWPEVLTGPVDVEVVETEVSPEDRDDLSRNGFGACWVGVQVLIRGTAGAVGK